MHLVPRPKNTNYAQDVGLCWYCSNPDARKNCPISVESLSKIQSVIFCDVDFVPKIEFPFFVPKIEFPFLCPTSTPGFPSSTKIPWYLGPIILIITDVTNEGPNHILGPKRAQPMKTLFWTQVTGGSDQPMKTHWTQIPRVSTRGSAGLCRGSTDQPE